MVGNGVEVLRIVVNGVEWLGLVVNGVTTSFN